MSTRKSSKLTLSDKLSRLSLQEVNDLLGSKAKSLVGAGSRYDFDLSTQVKFNSESFVLTFVAPDQCRVTLMLSDDRKYRLKHHCSNCPNVCEHVGAAYSLILEEKTALGLAIAPDDSDKEIATDLTDEELVEREIGARRERAKEEKMRVRSSNPKTPWADYQISSKSSGKTWRVALRGMQMGESYCSCPDFRKNTLGICKHIFHVQRKIARRFSERQLKKPYKLRNIIVHLQYQGELTLRVTAPEKTPANANSIIKPFLNQPVTNLRGLVKAISKLEQQGVTAVVYPDAEEYIQQQLEALHLEREIEKISDNKNNLGKNLLKVELLPYQLEGILFAAKAGRVILADDMGLGKTIQGIGTAELLASIINISKVLVICPASLKAQWRAEITRFCERDCQIIVGPADSRASQYNNQAFFTICNYEQVLRDILPIEQVKWDLIILDEGHRIKNWEAKTSQVVKSLRSRFALVLSGTPMENRLDELYSVAEFVDERRLGAGFRFYNRHRIVEEKTGKIIGYKNLAELRKNLQPILLRRTRASVLTELPPRTTDIIRITPTDEQQTMHTGHMQTVLSIVGKRYISEMDLLRLQKALLMCRMCANSTELVNKERPGHSSKLEHLNSLLPQLAEETDRKVVLFSEWTGMHKLIEAQLKAHKIGYVRLDGSVAQQKRAALVNQFRDDPSCRFFLATNAGSTGLNLQFANTLVNVDLPWTPAILEQRIGRIHRMGQKRPVQVYILITESTLEENLLGTLAAKHELSLAALDANSDIDEVELVSGMEALKRRLELLLGAKPEAPVDESQKADSNRQSEIASHRERMAVAGGQLMGAAFEFMDTMLPQAAESPPQKAMAKELQKKFLECVTTDEQGQSQLTITLPDETTLTKLSETIARMMASGVANDK